MARGGRLGCCADCKLALLFGFEGRGMRALCGGSLGLISNQSGCKKDLKRQNGLTIYSVRFARNKINREPGEDSDDIDRFPRTTAVPTSLLIVSRLLAS